MSKKRKHRFLVGLGDVFLGKFVFPSGGVAALTLQEAKDRMRVSLPDAGIFELVDATKKVLGAEPEGSGRC